MLRVIVRSLLIGACAGAIVAAVMMYIAWDHNPQGVFHENGVIHWRDWLAVGLTWFAVITAFVSALSLLLGGSVQAPRASSSATGQAEP